MKRKSKYNNRSLADGYAWDAMSKYIRARDRGVCCTCGGRGTQAGHFISRSYKSIKFDERNVHAQCPRCNMYLSGAWDKYLDFMVKTYGEDVVKELMSNRNEYTKRTIADLNEIENYYKAKLKEVE